MLTIDYIKQKEVEKIKKIILVLVIITLMLIFTACSNGESRSVQSEITSEETEVSTTEETSTVEYEAADTDIEYIYLNILGEKYTADVTSENIEKLEKAKTVTEPVAEDLNLQEIGTISILYKENDEEEELGTAYLNGDDIYIQSYDNEYGAVLKFYTISSDDNS